ncbi:MAG: NAD(P)-dependent oxidoreductase [Candidatus Hodarchaeota archaeon]
MKILITAPFHEDSLKKLKEQNEVIYENWKVTGELMFDSSEIIKRINEEQISIIITEADEIDEDVINETSLKLIASTRGTPINVDREAASEKGIPIVYTPHRNADAVADLTVAMILCQARKIIEIDRFLRSGDFDSSELEEDEFANFFTRFEGRELRNLTIGIIGFGAIGSKVAKRLALGFGSKILYYDPYVPENHPIALETNAKKVNLETLLKESDMVTLHTPPVEETYDMIGKKEFALMKPTAHFFNLARAVCTDEDALYKAIKEKRIAGAGLDVFNIEPVDSDNRFLEFDNVTVMPHFGGNTQDVIQHQSEMIARDILNFLEGKSIKNLWNPEINEK